LQAAYRKKTMQEEQTWKDFSAEFVWTFYLVKVMNILYNKAELAKTKMNGR